MSIFKLLEQLKKSSIGSAGATGVGALKNVTSGRHTEAPGEPQPTMTKPVPEKKHIRADTQTHMDLKLEKAVDRSRWQSGVDAKDFGKVTESPANPGTHMVQAVGGQLGARKAGDGSPKTWYYFHFNDKTGKYGSNGDPDTESKLHRDIFDKVVAPQLAQHPRHAKGLPIAYDGITNPNMAVAHGKPNPHFPNNPYLKGQAQTDAPIVDIKSHAKMAKSGSWHVKIKGVPGYHPLKDIKDLGPEKGNNYVLHDGRSFHQSKIEDMKPAPKLTKSEVKKPWSPSEAHDYANIFQDATEYEDKHPAKESQKNPSWTYEHVPLNKIKADYGSLGNNMQQWQDFWARDKNDPELNYSGFEKYYQKNKDEMPVVLHAGNDGFYHVSDGHHRVGVAHTIGLKHIPAVVARPLKKLTKAEDDWKKEGGYTFNTVLGNKIHEVIARKDGKSIGNAMLRDKGKHMEVTNINVDPAHQRKGIASHIQKLAEETFKKQIKPSKIQTPEGTAFFHRKLTKSEIETLEKAAPGYSGEVDPEKDNVAVQNPIDKNRLVWQHSPNKAKKIQTSIDQNLDKFTSQFGEHGAVLKAAINRGLANKKHVDLVPTALKYDEIHTPRRRHFAYLVQGHPSTRIKHLGNGEFLWYQDRHGEGGRLPETWWKVNHQGIQDVTKQHIGKIKEIFGKSDKTSETLGDFQGDRNSNEKRPAPSYRRRMPSGRTEHGGLKPDPNDRASTGGHNSHVQPEGHSRLPAGTADGNGKTAGSRSTDLLSTRPKLNPLQAPKKLAKSTTNQVASIAVLDGDHLLMGKRNDSQRWTLPGGHLNGGEDPLTGARRELLEETGISIPLEAFHYLGSDDVVTFTGKKMIVHSFVAYGRYDTNSELDPDEEVQHWNYIDVTNGLPEEIRDNLHSPKNATLTKIGIDH